MARYTGGLIRSTELTTSKFGVNSGMFTLGQQLNAISQGLWPVDYDVILQFTGSGNWECPPGVTEISEYLIIAGGGCGGSGTGGEAGGGAGGMRQGTGLPVVPGYNYSISVGGGGTAAPSGDTDNGSNGIGSFIESGPGQTTYYVSASVGLPQNYYYVKDTQTDLASANVSGRTLTLFEGTTYTFDTSHPTMPAHPFQFSASANGPSVYSGSTQSGSQGSPGAYTQLVVGSPAPDLFYYCTVHPGMGGPVLTPEKFHIGSNGGGRGGGSGPSGDTDNKGKLGGSGGGGRFTSAGARAITLTAANGHNQTYVGTPNMQGSNGGDSAPSGRIGGGGGGAGGDAAPYPLHNPANGGDGGNALSSSISGSTVFYAGGGGGTKWPNDAPISPGVGGTGGNTTNFLEKGGGGNGWCKASDNAPISAAPLTGTRAEPGGENTGGGGGAIVAVPGNAVGGDGGSGIIIIKYKNKKDNKVFKFTGSGGWKNDFGAKTIEYLIQAGGGSGGNYYGGGGGAGGVRLGTLDVTNATEPLAITIGSGGVFSSPASDATARGGNGNDSTISGQSFAPSTGTIYIAANGGGGGGVYPAALSSAGHHGGCGGAGGLPNQPAGYNFFGRSLILNSANGHSYPLTGENTYRGPAIQGHNGSLGIHVVGEYSAAGGGGGTQEDGFGAVYTGPSPADGTGILTAGNGGNGIASTITGISTYYGGGGGGSCDDTPNVADPENFGIGGLGGGGSGSLYYSHLQKNGTENTGGGGGGAHHSPLTTGAGGSGIVVIKLIG